MAMTKKQRLERELKAVEREEKRLDALNEKLSRKRKELERRANAEVEALAEHAAGFSVRRKKAAQKKAARCPRKVKYSGVTWETGPWSTAYVDRLPNSAFLFCYRGIRHLPVVSQDGKLSVTHLNNAKARLSQTIISASAKRRVRAEIQRIAEAEGLEEASKKKASKKKASKKKASKKKASKKKASKKKASKKKASKKKASKKKASKKKASKKKASKKEAMKKKASKKPVTITGYEKLDAEILKALKAAKESPARPTGAVWLADVRQRMGGRRADQDDALLAAQDLGLLTLLRYDGPEASLTARQRSAVLDVGGYPRHMAVPR